MIRAAAALSAMSQSARQQQDHEHDNNNSSEATRPISVSVIPRADTGRSDECEDNEHDYEYPKKVHGDSYDKSLPRQRLCADRLKSSPLYRPSSRPLPGHGAGELRPSAMQGKQEGAATFSSTGA